MRITNTMITGNTKSNINSNKWLVDKYNTQMTTQKKISKASENPVIAIRSLRLSTKMSHISQYVNNNIPDAQAWMDVTETALTNMKSLLTDIRTHCVNGSTDTKNEDDRKIILDGLKALADQVYAEGNADYAGKSVFTGYRTSSMLTFAEDELDTRYRIEQNFSFSDLEEKRYYTGDVKVPEAITPNTPECNTKIAENTYERVRLAYGGDTQVNTFTYGYAINETTNLEITATRNNAGGYDITTNEVVTAADGTITKTAIAVPADMTAPVFKTYPNEMEWEADTAGGKEVGKVAAENEIIYIEETGEFIFGKDIANNIADKECFMNVDYEKQGFENGELRPEYYYNCTDMSDDDETKWVTYTKQNQEIHYTIANNMNMTINTQADEVFDSNIKRDVVELINVVQKAIDAHNKVDKIKEMMEEEQYQDAGSQKMLKDYLIAAEKEMDYADDNLQKTYEQYIGRFDGYLQDVNIAITNIGSMSNSLKMTQTRVENQETTLEELKSENEDRDISDIIIDYYAAYNAYQSSLTAAGKLGERSLLDYI